VESGIQPYSPGSNPASTAGAIAGKMREGLKVAVRACGADAVANAVYAVAHARKYLKAGLRHSLPGVVRLVTWTTLAVIS
jgi:stage V sporulation protein SpoVS